MRFLFVVTCAVALHFVSSFVLNEDLIRSKRSPDNETFSLKKVKDGVVTFGNKVSGAAVHGYEELKNLFSSKRKVGDYNIDKLDVRFGEEETTTVEEETATVAEDETITENQNEVRKKRAANEMSHDFTVDLDELAKHIRVLDTTKSEKSKNFFESRGVNSNFYLLQNQTATKPDPKIMPRRNQASPRPKKK